MYIENRITDLVAASLMAHMYIQRISDWDRFWAKTRAKHQKRGIELETEEWNRIN